MSTNLYDVFTELFRRDKSSKTSIVTLVVYLCANEFFSVECELSQHQTLFLPGEGIS